MIKRASKSICALIFILMVSLSSTVQAGTESLTINAGKDVTRSIELGSEDRIQLTCNVRVVGIAQSLNNFQFWIIFPNATIKDYGTTAQVSINFISDVKGNLELHFDNSNSSDAKLVTLNYDIEHYIFGLPQILVLLFAVAVFLVCIAAGYIIMGKYS
jgi:uncharacterized protein (UPF0333 family)